MYRASRRDRRRIMAFVMAGGQGKRLQPLTDKRSKPAVPFGSRYRMVDFVLSNLVNSGIFTIYLLVQYKSQSLIEHIRNAWTLSPLLPDEFVTVVPPQMLEGDHWFQGTADCICQNLNLIEKNHPELVLVFGADHVYRMDVSQMIDFHLQHEADVTIAALPVDLHRASEFGVITCDADDRIRAFEEKPEHPIAMPGDPDRVLASMGNYLFKSDVLVQALREGQRRGETDFGKQVLPRLLHKRRLLAYDFGSNQVPGVKAYEERAYWRDVGSIDAYFEAHKDLLGLTPRFDLFNPQWPIFSSNYQGTVARVVGGEIENSLLGAATVIEGARLRNSIVRREAVVEDGAQLDECIIMDYVRIGRGARLRRTIVDRHNLIKAGTQLGYDPQRDRKRYTLSPSGVVVVPRGRSPFYARDRGRWGPGYAE